MFKHKFGNAGTRTVRMHIGSVIVSLTNDEYLHYKLTVQGAEPVFTFACAHRALLSETDFPGHPKQVYEWDWGKKPADSDADDDMYVVAMSFITAVKYTLLVEYRRSDNSVKETLIDADYKSQDPNDKFREILSVFTS